MAVVLSVAIGYVSGSLPWGLWLGRWFRGVDVRTLGSRNLGATNVFRSLGRGLGIGTLALDMAKGALPVLIVPASAIGAAFPAGREAAALTVGMSAIAGHLWTFLAGFRGGKGVATSAGVLLALSPPSFLAFAIAFLVTVFATRFISLGSMIGAVVFAVTLAFVAPGGVRSPTFVFGVAVAALVIVRHRENIQRLANGTERRFDWNRGGTT